MKKLLLTAVTLAALFVASAIAQTRKTNSPFDNLHQFDHHYWTEFYRTHHANQNGLSEFVYDHQRNYIKDRHFPSQPITRPNPVP